MPRRRIGQERFGFDARDGVTALDELQRLIDWVNRAGFFGGCFV